VNLDLDSWPHTAAHVPEALRQYYRAFLAYTVEATQVCYKYPSPILGATYSQLPMCQSVACILRSIKIYAICCVYVLYCEGEGCSSEGD
jgi:hypothetical protein